MPRKVPKKNGQNGHIIDLRAYEYHIAHMPSESELVEDVRKELKGGLSKVDATRVIAAVIKAMKVRSDRVIQFRGSEPFIIIEVKRKDQISRAGQWRDWRPQRAGVAEPSIDTLTPNEERLAAALQAVIAAAGADDEEALKVMRTIGEGIEIPKGAADEAFERVRLRSLGADSELRNAEGGGLSDIEFAARLGLNSRETVRQYREKGRIFAWRRDTRSFRYPAWQIYQGQLLPGLSEVLTVLAGKHLKPFSITSYFLTPSDDLDARPLDLLRDSKLEEVVADAKRYGDIGS
jgi:hypothetical protein